MSAFRDSLACDLVNVFLNLDEFGETHTIDDSGQPIACVIDEDSYSDVDNGGDLGITIRSKVLYAREEDVKRRSEGQTIAIDGRIYTVIRWRVDEGLHRVNLVDNTPRWG